MKNVRIRFTLSLFMVALMVIGALFSLLDSGKGLTFSSEHIIADDPNEQNYVDVASIGEGNGASVYVVYEDYSFGVNNPHINFKSSTNAGNSFGAAVDFMPSPQAGTDKQRVPSFAIHYGQTSTTLAVVYLDSQYTSTPGLAEYTICVKISSDGGSTWSTDYQVTSSPNQNYNYPKITFDPNGNLFVIWSLGSKIFLSYSTDNGAIWSNSQMVKEMTAPNTGYSQQEAEVAATSTYVGVIFKADPDWVENIYFTRALTNNLDMSPLDFSEPVKLPTEIVKDKYGVAKTYKTFTPDMVADSTTFYMVWWDFSTDLSGGNDQDPVVDRPCIKFTRTSDGGTTFSVGSKHDIKVNSSTPDGWHSPAEISINENGMLSVVWIDRTLKQPNIFVTTSSDRGTTWTAQSKVNSYNPDIERLSPMVSMDSSNNAHVVWLVRNTPTSDRDIRHARSIIDQAPEAIDDLNVIIYEEFYGQVAWTINREPDFKEYRTYISTTSGFAISSTPWPGGPLYNTSSILVRGSVAQSMNTEIYRGLAANTRYYAKVEVVDMNDLASVSNEVSFKTLPINMGPEWHRLIPTIYMVEDTPLLEALNMSYWYEMGWVTDDNYSGISDIDFQIEQFFKKQNITSSKNYELELKGYDVFDFFPSGDKQNWFGQELFRIIASDPGKDGGFGTPDDAWTASNWFVVQMNSTNDMPNWDKFYDDTGFSDFIKLVNNTYSLPETYRGCIERQPYIFYIRANDVDGDFVTFRASDPRVEIIQDQADPQHKSVFTFTPNNNDVPHIGMNITADDMKGGQREFTLIIPVQNVNDPPFLVSVNGLPVKKEGDKVSFKVNETQTVTFTVKGGDIDPSDKLSLITGQQGITVSKVDPFTFSVTYKAPKFDPKARYINFEMLLRDSALEQVILSVNMTIANIQDPVEFRGEKIEVTFVYDQKDDYEWNSGSSKGGSKIQAEWGEEIKFEGFAYDPDGDLINYTWTISNLKNTFNKTVYGKTTSFWFLPTGSNLTDAVREKFKINLTITDTHFPRIGYQIELWVENDPDNDNDGLVDKREKFFFDLVRNSVSGRSKEDDYYFALKDRLTPAVMENWLLFLDPLEDVDDDEYTNIYEIGFEIAQQADEKKTPYSLNTNEIDPLDPNVYPGKIRDPVVVIDDPPNTLGIPTWVLVLIIVIIVIILAAVLGIFIILRINKIREKKEEEDIDKRVAAMDKRQKELQGLYGVQKAGEVIGPDQSTLDDLQIDTGGVIYHEEGSAGVVGKMAKGSKKEGPQWEKKVQGPLFEKSAPKLDLGESLKLETIEIDSDTTQIDHNKLDQDAVESSMDDLIKEAEHFDPNAEKDAGGHVMVGALVMEEQMKLRQGQQRGSFGPRVPPPGMEHMQQPPQQGVPPGPAPPMRAPPGQYPGQQPPRKPQQ